jgi:hypothetical protein
MGGGQVLALACVLIGSEKRCTHASEIVKNGVAHVARANKGGGVGVCRRKSHALLLGLCRGLSVDASSVCSHCRGACLVCARSCPCHFVDMMLQVLTEALQARGGAAFVIWVPCCSKRRSRLCSHHSATCTRCTALTVMINYCMRLVDVRCGACCSRSRSLGGGGGGGSIIVKIATERSLSTHAGLVIFI